MYIYIWISVYIYIIYRYIYRLYCVACHAGMFNIYIYRNVFTLLLDVLACSLTSAGCRTVCQFRTTCRCIRCESDVWVARVWLVSSHAQSHSALKLDENCNLSK